MKADADLKKNVLAELSCDPLVPGVSPVINQLTIES